MKPDRQLIDEIFRDRIRRARALPLEKKLCGGVALFEAACHRMRDGIRWQHPEFDEMEVEQELRRRLKRIQAAEDFGIYQVIEEAKL